MSNFPNFPKGSGSWGCSLQTLEVFASLDHPGASQGGGAGADPRRAGMGRVPELPGTSSLVFPQGIMEFLRLEKPSGITTKPHPCVSGHLQGWGSQLQLQGKEMMEKLPNPPMPLSLPRSLDVLFNPGKTSLESILGDYL